MCVINQCQCVSINVINGNAFAYAVRRAYARYASARYAAHASPRRATGAACGFVLDAFHSSIALVLRFQFAGSWCLSPTRHGGRTRFVRFVRYAHNPHLRPLFWRVILVPQWLLAHVRNHYGDVFSFCCIFARRVPVLVRFLRCALDSPTAHFRALRVCLAMPTFTAVSSRP